MPSVVMICDFVDPDDPQGRTYRQINQATEHSLPLGCLVEVDVEQESGGHTADDAHVQLKGRCRLYVVSHSRDCDGTPLYTLSDLPVRYPTGPAFSSEKCLYHRAGFVVNGYSEDALQRVDVPLMPLADNFRAYFGVG